MNTVYHNTSLFSNKLGKNPFRDYLGFLQSLDVLSEDEQMLVEGAGHEFLRMLERTRMTRVYKMPVLQSLYTDGHLRAGATTQAVLDAWKGFFGTAGRWRDNSMASSLKSFDEIPDSKHLDLIRRNPIDSLQKSGLGYFVAKDGYELALSDDLVPLLTNPALSSHFDDIVEFRIQDYFRQRYVNRQEHVPAADR